MTMTYVILISLKFTTWEDLQQEGKIDFRIHGCKNVPGQRRWQPPIWHALSDINFVNIGDAALREQENPNKKAPIK